MSEPESRYDAAPALDLSPEMQQAVRDLLQELGPDRLVRLVGLLAAVRLETGYGDVTIVMAEGKVVGMKKASSFK